MKNVVEKKLQIQCLHLNYYVYYQEAMMAAHYRAEALERARQLAEAERGRARTRAFLGE